MRHRPILRWSLTLLAVLLSVLPARSVIPAKDSETTLGNLLLELKQSYANALESDSLLVHNERRREQVSAMLKSADDITIMLYSQRPDFAFDIAFALENVSRVYDSFRSQARLSSRYMIASRSGLQRYTLLGETLRDMYLRQPSDSTAVADSLWRQLPAAAEPEEDPEKAALLDSCLFYTEALTSLYEEALALAMQDSTYFAQTESRLQQAYEYAQANYADTQKNRYIGGNVNIIQILKNRDTFFRYVRNDLKTRYSKEPVKRNDGENAPDDYSWSGRYVLAYAGMSLILLILAFLLAGLICHFIFKFVRREDARSYRPLLSAILAVMLFALGVMFIKSDRSNPYWRMAFQLLSQFSWLTLAIFVSLLIRIPGSQARASRNLYIPTLLLAFLCILLRAVFLPASAVPVLFPMALLLFIIWQSVVNVRNRWKVSRTDLRYTWASVGVMAIAGILSLAGYSMIGVLMLTFWTFQLALLHTITTLYFLIKRYYDNQVARQKVRYHEENPELPLSDPNAFIEVTWFYDLLRMVVIPIAILASIPLSVRLTAKAYQLSLAGADILRHPLFQQEGLEFLTVSKLLIVLALFFVFRYVIYLVRALLRVFRLRYKSELKGRQTPLKESDVNLSLPNALISLLGWLFYLIIVFSILHIPTDTLKAIAAGLAAGVGFALKDLINNFFYGIQLMAGRIRVGDKISCDGVRGIVKRVSYQTTQVEDEDGSLIAFTNSDLFTKRFRNLNSGRNYELLRIPVCVRYGTDIEFARKVILEALEPMMTQDSTGRNIVDPSFPVDIRFDSFGDSSVNLMVTLYTTVETHYTFPARAKEAIYNAFYKNGIEIPFHQHDIYIKTMPEDKPKPESDTKITLP